MIFKIKWNVGVFFYAKNREYEQNRFTAGKRLDFSRVNFALARLFIELFALVETWRLFRGAF